MDNNTLYRALACCEVGEEKFLTAEEKDILLKITDFSIFTKSTQDFHKAKDLFDKMLQSCSLEFIQIVTSNLKKIPNRKTLLSSAMFFDITDYNRTLEIIVFFDSKGYKIDEDIATYLLQEMGYYVKHDDSPKKPHIIETIQHLLNKGADINAVSQNGKGVTPLMQSIMYQSPSITNALIMFGADPNISNKSGETALLFACGKPMITAGRIPENDRTVKIVEILLNAGADIHHKIGKVQTALYWAKRTKRTKVLELLNTYNSNLTSGSS